MFQFFKLFSPTKTRKFVVILQLVRIKYENYIKEIIKSVSHFIISHIKHKQLFTKAPETYVAKLPF